MSRRGRLRAALHAASAGLRRFLGPVAPPPAVVDWGILLLVAFQVASGLLSFTVGTPDGAWVVWAHGVAGISLVAFLALKFARVAGRVTDRERWDRTTPVSILAGVAAVGALATGLFWALGGNVPVGPWTTLSLHVGLGLVLVPLVGWHLRDRFRLPDAETARDRRTALRVSGLLLAGTLIWRAQEALLATVGAGRRFTGSKPTGELWETDTEGGSFPVTSWVADDPDPVDPASWALTVTGQVEERRDFDLPALDAGASERATLDCTSGWYTVQEWGGVRVGDLLDSARVREEAEYVRFVSVTGYRWSLPLPEARDALLATRVGGDRLGHGHGAPARLVAPGRRGFQWVKWVDRVEVRAEADPAQWLVTLVSGFDG